MVIKELDNVKFLVRSVYHFSRLLTGGGLRILVFPRRYGTTSSSTIWKARQTRDAFVKKSHTSDLKSRAAFKLLEIDRRFNLMKPGMTVVDLGYAPGSWTQVAVKATSPGGRVLGVDVIPVAPPKGASSIQGDFLSPSVQAMVRRFLSHPDRGRPTNRGPQLGRVDNDNWHDRKSTTTVAIDQPGYIDQERSETEGDLTEEKLEEQRAASRGEHLNDPDAVRVSERNTVDLVLSDMSEPWRLEEEDRPWMPSIKIPFARMMNVSGIRSRDHLYSLNLCYAALKFCVDVLKPGGNFVCKFYKGNEDKELETILKKVFASVTRVKPEASRDESIEEYFVALEKLPVNDTTARAISKRVE